MSLERLNKALDHSMTRYMDDGWVARSDADDKAIIEAARVYRDLLANGELVEWCETHRLLLLIARPKEGVASRRPRGRHERLL